MMPEKLSDSVRVKYLNRAEILTQLRQAAKILKQNPNVHKVILFGSLVRGDFVPGSDADICIVLNQDNQRIIDRIPQFFDFFDDVQIPVEVFPYTIQECETMQQANNSLLREIMTTGIEL